MQSDFSNSIARIQNDSGYTVGAGFLIDEGILITAFFVVSNALSIKRNSSPPSDARVSISFPFSREIGTISASIEHWSEKDEISTLRFTKALPDAIQPVKFAEESDLWGHSYRSYGFPRGFDNGLWTGGTIRGQLADEKIQLLNDGKIDSGFAGAPVYDNSLKSVVGLIVGKGKQNVVLMISATSVAKHIKSVEVKEIILSPPQVFLCHASPDKLAIRQLYTRLLEDGFNPWFDEEDLVPGQKWEDEIRKAVHSSDAIVVCLSNNSVGKTGFVQKEIRMALDIADEKPDGQIFVIPLKLQECEVPDRLQTFQWVDLFQKRGYKRLTSALSLVQKQR